MEEALADNFVCATEKLGHAFLNLFAFRKFCFRLKAVSVMSSIGETSILDEAGEANMWSELLNGFVHCRMGEVLVGMVDEEDW